MSSPGNTWWKGWTTSPGSDLQTPFDAAVVVATILRPTLLQAVRSIFAQDIGGRVQIMIGIDKPKGDRGMIDRLIAECPSHCAITLCDPGYSTAALNGGTYSALTGGGLLSTLSTLANSRYVCYLDDDNWYAPEHLSSLRGTLDSSVGWVHSLRWFVNAYDDRCIAIDRWHAAGPDAGLYASTMRGLVDTNCYMIDKDRCWDMLWRWSHALQKKGGGNDRGVFAALLRKEPWRCSDQPTVYYRLPPEREWVVHHWHWKGIEPRANMRATPFAILANAVTAAIAPPSDAGSIGDPATLPPKAPELFQLTMQRMRPRSVVDLWTGDGHRAIGLALAARETEAPLRLLAVDTWLPVPADEHGKLQPLGVASRLYADFCRNVTQAGVEAVVQPLPQVPHDAAHMLRPSNTRIDLLMLPADRGDTESLLRPWWPMLKRSGAMLLEPGTLTPDEIIHRLSDFATARGARIGTVGEGGASMVVIRKADPVRPRSTPSGETAPASAT